MANSNAPSGLKAVRHKNGAPYSGSGSLYYVSSGNASIIAPGDPVVVTGTASSDGVPGVTLATAGSGNRITGVVIGRTNGDGTLLHDDALALPAATEGWLLVEDDPDVVFEIQCSGSIAATDISTNANLKSGTASALGFSGWEVDSTSFATGATLQLKVLRLVAREDNALGTNAKVEVMINQHTQTAATAGI